MVFSLAATKQINYILPALPFFGVLAGYQLWRRGAGEPGGRLANGLFWATLLATGGIWFVVLLVVPFGVPLAWEAIEKSIRFDSSEYAMPLTAPVMVLWPLVSALCAGGALAAVLLLQRQGRTLLVAPALCLLAALFGASLMFGLFPHTAGIIQQPAKEMAQAVRRQAGASVQVVTYGLWKPSLIYYTGRSLPRYRVEDTKRLGKLLAGDTPVFVYSRIRLKDRLSQVPGFVALAQYTGYLAGGNAAASKLWKEPAPGAKTP